MTPITRRLRWSATGIAAALGSYACSEPNPLVMFTSNDETTNATMPSVSADSTETTGIAAPDESSSGSTGTTGTGPATTDGSESEILDSSSTGPTVHCESNGLIENDEECDDDNPFAGDGCHDCLVKEGFVCIGEPSSCFIACDPLLPDCPAEQGCYAIGSVPLFACAPDASGKRGAVGDECEFVNICDSGLLCIETELLDDCDAIEIGCCALPCDIDAPDCPSMTTCIALYGAGMAPAGHEDVGFCD